MARQKDPTMKQLWAGMAMMALLIKDFEGTANEISELSWQIADELEAWEDLYERPSRSN